MVDRAEIMIIKNLFLSFGMFWDGGYEGRWRYELVNFFQKMEGYYIHSRPSPITLNVQLTFWMHLTNRTDILEEFLVCLIDIGMWLIARCTFRDPNKGLLTFIYQFINYTCNYQIVNFKINPNHMQTTIIFF